MKDNFTQSLLLVAVTLIGAYLVWGRGDAKTDIVDKTHKTINSQELETAIAKATNTLKEEISANQRRTDELNQIKTLVTEEISKATESIKDSIPEDGSAMIQDKISELQDQIKDLHSKFEEIEDSCGCAKKTVVQQCKCQNKSSAAQPKPYKKPEPKIVKCEEKVAYLDCLTERLGKWDEHCSNPVEPTIKTAIIEKTSTNKESQISIIESKEQRHAMCLAPREFYREQCRKQNCQ